MTGFILKMIAALSMTLDHAGLVLFPRIEWLRIAGRLAFPLYAWCIAEGFRYTRDRYKYFLRIFILGALCQIVYIVVERDLYLGTLITYSLAIVVMAAADCLKTALRGGESAYAKLWARTGKRLSVGADRLISAAVLAALLGLIFWLTRAVRVDYGFFGVLLPVFASLFENKWARLAAFSCCLAALCFTTAEMSVQNWSYLALPVLALYNGMPGRVRLKYFFYIFYPAHLAILYGISMLMGT